MIQIHDLHAYYGTIEALKGIDVHILKGKITCLIGSNGAGKSTLLKSISGACRHTGQIMYAGEDISKLSPQKVARLGITHVPEGRHVFPGLTVRENLEVGTINWHGFFGRQPYNKEMEEVFDLFPRLKERENQLSWSLSGGEQQMLAIGRGLMSHPKLLMLDEPSMGLAPILVDEIFEIIANLHARGATILLVEQNARMALSVADRGYVMETGRISAWGTGKELLASPAVRKAYLGG